MGKGSSGLRYVSPLVLWFLVFFMAPMAIILVTSFLGSDADGGIVWKPTLASYADLLSPGLLRVSLTTLWVSALSAVIVILLALPASYYIARSPHKNALLVLVIIPFWTNFIIRVFAWKRLLDSTGFINLILTSLGLIHEPVPLMRNMFAVVLINVYAYLPYAILPLFSTLEKFDFTLLEAARDLGASKPQSIARVLLPNIKGGITTAVFFTFIPLIGSFVVQQLAGNKDMYMLGNIITDRIKNRNQPMASAIGVLMMVFTTVGIWFMLKAEKGEEPKAAVSDSLADQGIKLKPFRGGSANGGMAKGGAAGEAAR